ncbi:hypothetical protein LZ480_08885 [Solibacillus sp. MA9]|uniref:Uncharacterized protein n=1 Tax=Solibacillus palustris TaxID=2908203 RepID=A0ABS9UCD7_9BACL|nr:hypothetical protein [Solibacillus sp. MA9]MCH7322007.1 hypothetical protein [Solibacillus sp. MA9]
MDEQFKNMQAPIRTSEQQIKSLNQIKGKIKQRQRMLKLQLIGTSFTAVALIFILFTLFITKSEPLSNQAATSASLQKAYYFSNHSEQPVVNIDKWYYTSKSKIANKDLNLLAQLANQISQSKQLYEEQQLPPAFRDFLLHYDDGTKRYLQFWTTIINDRHEQFVMDVTTKQVYELTSSDSELLQMMTQESNFFITLVRFVIFLAVLYVALFVCLHFNLLGNTEKLETIKAWKIFVLGIATYFYVVIVQGLSLYYFGAVNALFLGGILFLPFVLYHWRQFGKSNYQVSTWVLLVIAFVICCYIFLFT